MLAHTSRKRLLDILTANNGSLCFWWVMSTRLFLCAESTLGWGAREFRSQELEEWELCIDWKRLLSTQTSLSPWHMTWLHPGHVVAALLKVIQSASGGSHDLQHVTFLSTNITQPSLTNTNCTPTHRPLMSHSFMSVRAHRLWVFIVFDVWTLDRGGVSVNSWVMRVNGDDGERRGLKRNTLLLWPRVTKDHHH